MDEAYLGLRPQWVRSETLMDSVIIGVTTAPQRQAGRQQQLQRKPYPHFKVVVLDDDVNTFVHVVDCLVRYVPAMTPDQAWELAHQIDGQGAAVVWSGPQEQAELIHQQLGGQGLTMAPLEPA
ncbi:MAG: ATP-dependent Clp protease adaptor protein ClpS [Cyanobacteriota bacterium]